MSQEEQIVFVNRCEKIYHKTTREHIVEHEKRQYEGSPDERRWYRFAKLLEEKGYVFQ